MQVSNHGSIRGFYLGVLEAGKFRRGESSSLGLEKKLAEVVLLGVTQP